MKKFALYVRGEKVPSDPGSIAARLEPLFKYPNNAKWAIGKFSALLDPMNTAVTERKIKSALQELDQRDRAAAAHVEVLEEAEEVDVALVEDNQITHAVLETATKAFVHELGDWFFLEENAIKINPTNPPSVDQCYTIGKRLLGMRNTANQLGEFSTWKLGAFLDACECYFGADVFHISQFVEQTSRSYHTLVVCLSVFREFGHERFDCSFSHHREAHYCKDLPKEDKLTALTLAAKHQLSMAPFKKLLSFAKHTEGGFDALTLSQKENPDELLEVITNRSGARKFIFMIKGEAYHYKGHASELPEEASQVIDIGLKAWINPKDLDSPPKPLTEWKTSSPT